MKRNGILVQSRAGEETLRILSELGLNDHRFKIGRTLGKIQIPLLRPPSSLELELIQKRIGQFETTKADFEREEGKTQTLEATLSILPPDLRSSIPKAFDVIGDIIVIELTKEMDQYKGLIGQGLMTVHNNVKAVYAKQGPISGEDRVRPLQHLAGENRTVTVHKEFGCNFRVDIAKAFFSPRLSNEHKRVADLVQPGEHIMDMFSGVGPFSILIAKRSLPKVEIDAIDLNTDATNLLKENLRLNHVEQRVRVWNQDARAIVGQPELQGGVDRIIMNHPSMAKAFVDSAIQALKPTGGVIHYYTFAEGEEAEAYGVAELEESLEAIDWNIEETIFTRKVRGTGPRAWQVAVDTRVGPA